MLIFHWDFSENQERPDIHEKFWKVLTNDVDGSFYSNFIMDGVRASPRHVSFSSFKVKNVTPDTITWAQPTVYVEWELQVGHQTVILYDISPDLNVSRISLAHRSNPYAWHCLLGQIVTELYDTSAWQMSDIVRSIERGLRIIQELERMREDYADQFPEKKSELFSIKLRNQFLRERLNNALSLALNLTQMHAKSDSAAMKTIAVLSLIYLPGTFVSGLFGTNFFRYPAENSTEAWWASSKFWLYGAIAGPLTALTLAAWLCVYYYPKLRRWVSSRKTLKEKKRF
ncbi:hypothetical protein AJ79_10008 [Helicocarpus griseus UAMH5409]|uniref:Uncharacterized protein n=1 Tax=Helicocarpus griseus UAMH5409 TaxID=1447875 RepID=A0A2B7WG74_9EURO|nr:hypothetical protein AJ79_10008 [Helicocarpus griseus UAMH5409]